MVKLRIELVKSLGLKKMNDVVEHVETPELKGKLAQVSYLLKVEEVQA